ncbi:hypothetical protein GCM10007884_31180 [Methylobacterium brachythecii]|uniref:Uncharacterized protein n=1 Tax=Methylobacterium brachythecii TaxID=1176177 RepID=A0ABQ6D4D0_9HYPH|nr:hypothetical protein GCM10007884_31180 [Methylobacterium brachythecii]
MAPLPQIARDEIPKDGDRQAYAVLGRDRANVAVHTPTLTFAGPWTGEVALLMDQLPGQIQIELNEDPNGIN